MNAYQSLIEKHQAEINAFPFMWAFNERQFEEGMARLGLLPTDTDKIYSIGAGGFIRKSDAPAMHEMMKRHEAERAAAVAGDSSGEGYIQDMFRYELSNHEYGYTGDIEPTLDALGLTWEDVKADRALSHGLSLALSRYTD